MTTPDTRDSVERIVEQLRVLADYAADYGLSGIRGKAKLDTVADRLSALPQQAGGEDAEDARHMYRSYVAAQERAEAAEAALAEARTHVTGYVGLAKMTGYDTLIPLLTAFLTRTAKEPKDD